MNKVVITGTGFVTSIGSDLEAVVSSLKELKHGFGPFPAWETDPTFPPIYGAVDQFDLSAQDQEDWVYPEKYKIKRSAIKSMPPHVFFGYCALKDAMAQAELTESEIGNGKTGLYSASAGSSVKLHEQVDIMNQKGILKCSPFSVVQSIVGTLNFNLCALFKIQGASCGMASACASSAHAMGFAFDEIAMGRQERMFVLGAEDGNRETILPFASMRALSFESDPELASCPFDIGRNGFVGTGGAVALVLESEQSARARGARILAEFAGWGQASDGYSPAMSHPEGAGLIAAMKAALTVSGSSADSVDYINAHATSTIIGDRSEIRALKALFRDCKALVSSTKALTGHGLSLAGAMEAAFCVAAIDQELIPGSAHIRELDPECEGLNILKETLDQGPKTVMSNSSGFGGANVSLLFKKWPN